MHCLTTSSNLWFTIAVTRFDLLVSLGTSYLPFLIRTRLKTVSSFFNYWNLEIFFFFFLSPELELLCSEIGVSFCINSGPSISKVLVVLPGEKSCFLVASKETSSSSEGLLYRVGRGSLMVERMLDWGCSAVDLILWRLMELLLGS